MDKPVPKRESFVGGLVKLAQPELYPGNHIDDRTTLRTPRHEVTLAAWSSPNMELAKGQLSRKKAGSAAVQKATAFDSLCAQSPFSFVLLGFRV